MWSFFQYMQKYEILNMDVVTPSPPAKPSSELSQLKFLFFINCFFLEKHVQTLVVDVLYTLHYSLVWKTRTASSINE